MTYYYYYNPKFVDTHDLPLGGGHFVVSDELLKKLKRNPSPKKKRIDFKTLLYRRLHDLQEEGVITEPEAAVAQGRVSAYQTLFEILGPKTEDAEKKLIADSIRLLPIKKSIEAYRTFMRALVSQIQKENFERRQRKLAEEEDALIMFLMEHFYD
jgi:hypothetical protein